MLLRDIHSKLITQYDCKEVCVPSPSQVNAGASGGLSSQDGVSQQQEPTPLSIPEINHLIEDSFVWDETSASNGDVTVIPSHHLRWDPWYQDTRAPQPWALVPEHFFI